MTIYYCLLFLLAILITTQKLKQYDEELEGRTDFILFELDEQIETLIEEIGWFDTLKRIMIILGSPKCMVVLFIFAHFGFFGCPIIFYIVFALLHAYFLFDFFN